MKMDHRPASGPLVRRPEKILQVPYSDCMISGKLGTLGISTS